MTRETGMEIGTKIGMVLDIDVLEKGVQWGKFLRVRIRFDATKKMVRGKRVSIEAKRADGYSSNTSGCLTSATSVESWIMEKRNV